MGISDSAAREAASALPREHVLHRPVSQSVSHTLLMLQLSSLITSEDQGPVRFIMGLWCLLIHNRIVCDRQPKIKPNKVLWEGGLNNFVGSRTKKKVSK